MAKEISENIEEYLEVLYKFGSKDSYVSTTTLSRELGIAPGSVTQMLKKLEEIITRGDAYKISMLNVSGNDLLEKGFAGKDVGEILNKLLLDVIENPNLNTYENLINSKHLSR